MSYIESRSSNNSMSAMAIDIAKHIQSRQHLGKVIIICDRPVILMSMVRKHWLKLARMLQKERAGTINAERILLLTSNITHMHQMSFVGKLPAQQPAAHAYFITPDQAQTTVLPINTYTLYVTMAIDVSAIQALIEQLPTDSLIVDYASSVQTSLHAVLRPKLVLEQRIHKEWKNIAGFLDEQRIDVELFSHFGNAGVEAADDALDILLGTSHHFLYLASNLQRSFDLAQPFSLSPSEQRQYQILMTLAHRVQALNPATNFSAHSSYDLAQDDTFFLHDHTTKETMSLSGLLSHAIERHNKAGRHRLARALLFAIY